MRPRPPGPSNLRKPLARTPPAGYLVRPGVGRTIPSFGKRRATRRGSGIGLGQRSSAVEQGTHKPLVGSSILPAGTKLDPGTEFRSWEPPRESREASWSAVALYRFSVPAGRELNVLSLTRTPRPSRPHFWASDIRLGGRILNSGPFVMNDLQMERLEAPCLQFAGRSALLGVGACLATNTSSNYHETTPKT